MERSLSVFAFMKTTFNRVRKALSVTVKSVLDRLCKAPAAPEKDIVHEKDIVDGLYQASSATEKKLDDQKAFEEEVLLNGPREDASAADIESDKKALLNDHEAPQSAPEDQHVLLHGLSENSSPAEKEAENEGYKKACVNDPEAPRSAPEDQHVLLHAENEGYKKACVNDPEAPRSAPEDQHVLLHGLSEISSPAEKEENESDKNAFVNDPDAPRSAPEDQHVVLKSSSAAEKEGDKKCHVDGHGEAYSAPEKDVLNGSRRKAWSAAKEAFLDRVYRAFSVDKKTLVNGLSKAFSAAVDTFLRSLFHALFMSGKTRGQRLSVALSQAKVMFIVNLVRDLSKCSNAFVVGFCEALFAAVAILLPLLVELL